MTIPTPGRGSDDFRMARYPDIEDVLRKVGTALRVRGRSHKTVDTYLSVVRRFLRFHRAVSTLSVDERHLREYMAHLTDDRRLAGGSRNQSASALAFFYREVLHSDAAEGLPRARQSKSTPVVFSHAEATRVIDHLNGRYRLIGSVLYGSGVRLGECLRLRVKDLDFDLTQITVRDGKGGKDRMTVLPRTLQRQLREQVQCVEAINAADRRGGNGWAALPHALFRKDPRAGYSLAWQFVFPASRVTIDSATGRRGRRHLHPTAVQRTIKRAIHEAGIAKAASTHTFRHTFATQILRDGCDPKTVQRLLGHADLRTTTAYLHAIDNVGLNVRSPIDRPTRTV